MTTTATINQTISEEEYIPLCESLGMAVDPEYMPAYYEVSETMAAGMGLVVIATSDPNLDTEYEVIDGAYSELQERMIGNAPSAWQILRDLPQVYTLSFEDINTFGVNEPCVAYVASANDIPAINAHIRDYQLEK